MINPPEYRDIVKAAKRIDGVATRTPLIENDHLNERTRAQVFIKPECLQVTGSFKFRGAYNAIAALGCDQKRSGIVACSSGNHAQGIAQAAKLLGAEATIIMPEDSPQIKLARTQRSGAKIVTYDRQNEDRDEIALRLCAKTGAVFIHPYEHPDVIAGQGTVGLEMCAQVSERGGKIDRVLVCTGGGGLTAGVSLAVAQHFAEAKIHSVEPADFDDTRRSLITGVRLKNALKSGSICDALLSETPGDLSFSINQKLLAEGFAVSESEVLEAIKFAFDELKLVVEPGGAVALAALLGSGNKWSGETICCVISGGNIDPEILQRALAV